MEVTAGDLIRFNRDTHCFEKGPVVPSNFTIPAGSVGIVLRETQCVGRTYDYHPLFEVLVDGKILFANRTWLAQLDRNIK